MYSKNASFRAPSHPVWRRIDGVVGDMVFKGDGRFLGYIIGTAAGMHAIHFASGSPSYTLPFDLWVDPNTLLVVKNDDIRHFRTPNAFSCRSRERVHICTRGNLRVEALSIRSLSTPGSTQTVHASSRTTTFYYLTLPPSLFMSISGTHPCMCTG